MPVGISIGEPKFPLGYTPEYMKRLAPWGLREIGDDEEFAWRYHDRLVGIGVAAIQRRFLSISAEHDGRGLCLLCFEPVGTFSVTGVCWPDGLRSRPGRRFLN